MPSDLLYQTNHWISVNIKNLNIFPTLLILLTLFHTLSSSILRSPTFTCLQLNALLFFTHNLAHFHHSNLVKLSFLSTAPYHTYIVLTATVTEIRLVVARCSLPSSSNFSNVQPRTGSHAPIRSPKDRPFDHFLTTWVILISTSCWSSTAKLTEITSTVFPEAKSVHQN